MKLFYCCIHKVKYYCKSFRLVKICSDSHDNMYTCAFSHKRVAGHSYISSIINMHKKLKFEVRNMLLHIKTQNINPIIQNINLLA